MYERRKIDSKEIEKIDMEFREVISIIYNRVMLKKPVKKLSKAVIEALYVGVQRNLTSIKGGDMDLHVKLEELLEDDLFSKEALSEGIGQKKKVIDRLSRAVEIFS